MTRKLNVLVVAEACNPAWTSVPLVGYQIARALARREDLAVTVATHERNRASLRNDDLAREAHVEFIDSDAVSGPMYRLGTWLRGGSGLGYTTNTAAAWPGYIWFEHLIHRRFQRSLQQGHFDLIHRVTPVTMTLGSPLVSLTKTPMVIGPLNGGLPWPEAFPELRAKEREWLTPLRKAYQMLPYHRSTVKRAAALIGGSRRSVKELGEGRGRRDYLPENGIDPERFPIADAWPEPRGAFQIVTVGRLVPLKGFDLLIDALAHSPKLKDTKLVIAGDGPCREALENQAKQLGLADRVRFPGWMAQEKLSELMRSSQLFAFPSLREFGGGVVLEAMASGLPCIVANYGGPAELVTDDCGLKVDLAPRPEMVKGLQAALESLVGDPERCRVMGASAARRIRAEFTWDRKAERLVEVYRGVLGKPR